MWAEWLRGVVHILKVLEVIYIYFKHFLALYERKQYLSLVWLWISSLYMEELEEKCQHGDNFLVFTLVLENFDVSLTHRVLLLWLISHMVHNLDFKIFEGGLNTIIETRIHVKAYHTHQNDYIISYWDQGETLPNMRTNLHFNMHCPSYVHQWRQMSSKKSVGPSKCTNQHHHES